ncbi:MAG: M50 family metallopeptidase [Pirellulaceae bacterium]
MTQSESAASASSSPSDVTDPRLAATAYHEAGHAVMALLLGRAVHKVTVAPGQILSGVRLGACEMRKGRLRASNDPLEDEVLILLAGMVAESQCTGEYCRQGASQDLQAVRRLLSHNRAHNERQLERLEQRLIDKTEHLLNEAAALEAIRLIAVELLAKTTLSGRAVRHLLTQAQQRSST